MDGRAGLGDHLLARRPWLQRRGAVEKDTEQTEDLDTREIDHHMKIGTYYYPEQWPASSGSATSTTWPAMGLQIVHMGEFAWFSLEPQPGEFRFDWLDECVEMARKRQHAT